MVALPILCQNFLGCDPHFLVDSANHLSCAERKNLKYQFTELPELINAVGGTRARLVGPHSVGLGSPPFFPKAWRRVLPLGSLELFS